MAIDPLSQLLGSLHFENARYTRFETGAPWGHRVTHSGQIKFVFVVGGSCWLRTRALTEPERLLPNDLFVILDSEPYAVSDSPDSSCVDCVMLETRRDGYSIRYGGDGARTTLVSVAFSVDAAEAESLLLALPPLIQLRMDQNRSHALQMLMELLRIEIGSTEMGALPVVQRLAEALFIAAVRAHLQSADGARQGILAAIADAQLARAVSDMHGDLSQPWTVEDLARSARMSRASFAARFRAAVGQAPLEYLTQLRMDRARSLIREGVAITEVASRVGYDSAISFTRAFGRVTGKTPGAYKRAALATVPNR